MPRRPLGDVIVMLPGITGSVLEKDGKEIWAPTGGAVLNALLTLGHDIKDLTLTDDPPDVDDLGDGVVATRVMPDIHLIPGLWKIDGYSKLTSFVIERFDVELGKNLFEFPYDWRRDNRVAARKLDRATAGWLKSWREQSGHKDAKLILVGHSMGGLISRYYLECLDGWKNTRALVTFGTPYRGSLKALGMLANGMEKKFGPIGLDLSGLVRSLTSVYQLLPVYPCFDPGDGKLVRVIEAAIPHVTAEKAAAAHEFHDQIAEAVTAHEDDPAYLADRYVIRPVIGTFQPTAQSAHAHDGGVQLVNAYNGADLDGDGTVPRVSATPVEVEHEQNAMFAAQQHASLQNDDAVLVQLAGILSSPALDLTVFRALPTISVGLEIDDVYTANETVNVRALPEQDPPAPLTVVVENTKGPPGARSIEAQKVLARAADGTYAADVGPFATGTYRLTVESGGATPPVTDVFVVVPEGGV